MDCLEILKVVFGDTVMSRAWGCGCDEVEYDKCPGRSVNIQWVPESQTVKEKY